MGKDRVANLTPFKSSQDKEKARENGRAGGLASASSRRLKKSVREFLQDYLGRESPPELRKRMELYGVPNEYQTNEAALFVGVFHKAMRDGDPEAANTVLSWAGLLPLQEERETAELACYQRMPSSEEKIQSLQEDDSSFQDVVIYDPKTQKPKK